MLESQRSEQSPTWCPLQKAFLDQERLDDVLDGVTRLRQRGSERVDTDWTPSVTRGNRRKVAAVHRVQPGRIDFERQQRAVGNFPIDGPGAVDMGKVAHTAQEPSGDAWGATRAARNFVSAVGCDSDAQDTRTTIDDLFQFLLGIKIESHRDAETVAQWIRQQSRTRGCTDQGERREIDLDGT